MSPRYPQSKPRDVTCLVHNLNSYANNPVVEKNSAVLLIQSRQMINNICCLFPAAKCEDIDITLVKMLFQVSTTPMHCLAETWIE